MAPLSPPASVPTPTPRLTALPPDGSGTTVIVKTLEGLAIVALHSILYHAGFLAGVLNIAGPSIANVLREAAKVFDQPTTT